MKLVTLVFPDTTRLADFITKYKVSNAEVVTSERKVTLYLSEALIDVALAQYNATLVKQHLVL